jgi:hypothetical protein
MPRRRKRRAQTISLFPFLSVLAATIGTLALVISGMTSMSLLTSSQVVEKIADGSLKKPLYVECRKEGLLIHPKKTFIPLDEISDRRGRWSRCLESIEDHSGHQCLVLLIRPNGIDSFQRASARAERANIDYGYDPIYQSGPLKFADASTGGDVARSLAARESGK